MWPNQLLQDDEHRKVHAVLSDAKDALKKETKDIIDAKFDCNTLGTLATQRENEDQVKELELNLCKERIMQVSENPLFMQIVDLEVKIEENYLN